jgi:hypothetical protein
MVKLQYLLNRLVVHSPHTRVVLIHLSMTTSAMKLAETVVNDHVTPEVVTAEMATVVRGRIWTNPLLSLRTRVRQGQGTSQYKQGQATQRSPHQPLCSCEGTYAHGTQGHKDDQPGYKCHKPEHRLSKCPELRGEATDKSDKADKQD